MRVAMDDLLRDFLTETFETIDRVDAELVRFEQDPDNQSILGQIFRLVHTIKGACGFIGLDRLERLTHAAESVIGGFSEDARHRPGGDADSGDNRPDQADPARS
jgi:two-component system chemotaxis sensor kinase CheA